MQISADLSRMVERLNAEGKNRGRFTAKDTKERKGLEGLVSGLALAKYQRPGAKYRFCYGMGAQEVTLRPGWGVCNLKNSHGLPASSRWTAVRARSVLLH